MHEEGGGFVGGVREGSLKAGGRSESERGRW